MRSLILEPKIRLIGYNVGNGHLDYLSCLEKLVTGHLTHSDTYI